MFYQQGVLKMTVSEKIKGEKRPFKEWTGDYDFSSVPPGREDPYMNLKDWYAPLSQHVRGMGESYGQMRDGTGRSIFRMQVERDADEGMRGYSGEAGTGDGQHLFKQANFGRPSSTGVDINSKYGFGDESAPKDLHGHLPKIHNYEELVKTKEGRDKIRAIRKRQLSES
jgi:hypothetical protein